MSATWEPDQRLMRWPSAQKAQILINLKLVKEMVLKTAFLKLVSIYCQDCNIKQNDIHAKSTRYVQNYNQILQCTILPDTSPSIITTKTTYVNYFFLRSFLKTRSSLTGHV